MSFKGKQLESVLILHAYEYEWCGNWYNFVIDCVTTLYVLVPRGCTQLTAASTTQGEGFLTYNNFNKLKNA